MDAINSLYARHSQTKQYFEIKRPFVPTRDVLDSDFQTDSFDNPGDSTLSQLNTLLFLIDSTPTDDSQMLPFSIWTVVRYMCQSVAVIRYCNRDLWSSQFVSGSSEKSVPIIESPELSKTVLITNMHSNEFRNRLHFKWACSRQSVPILNLHKNAQVGNYLYIRGVCTIEARRYAIDRPFFVKTFL